MVDDLGEYDVQPVEGNPFGSMASSPNDFDVAPVDHDPFADAGENPAPDQFELASRQPEATPSSAGGPPLDPHDRQDLIRTVFGEASDQPRLGQAAVAHAILNRVHAGGYGDGISGVIHAPAAGTNPKFGYHEFSPWNTGRAKEGNPTAQNLSPDSKDPRLAKAYRDIGDVVDKSYSGLIPDPTHGATHYYGYMPRPPSWAAPLAKQNTVRIGGQTFVGYDDGPGRAPTRTASYAGGGPVQLNEDLRQRLALLTSPRHGFADGGAPDPNDPNAAGFSALDKMVQSDRDATPEPAPAPQPAQPQLYGGAWGQSAEDAYQNVMGKVGSAMDWAGDKLESHVGTAAATLGLPNAAGFARDARAMLEMPGEGFGRERPTMPAKIAENNVGVLRHADEAFPEGRIATAVPSNKALLDSAHASNERTIGHDTMQADPEMYGKTADLIRAEYPDIKIPANATDEEVHNAFIAQTKSNILALHDAVPDDISQGSRQWYDGANTIASDRARRYGKPLENVGGVYAALSPKMDWFKNVSLGDRLMDVMHNQKFTSLTPEMDEWITNRYGAGATPADVNTMTVYNKLRQHAIGGGTLSDLQDPFEQAHWVRAYDEAHNPRGYNIVNPDGSYAGPALTGQGEPGEVGWAGFKAMANGIRSFNAQDMPTISRAMGDRHKVRSFYNNIVAPYSDAGDVTADTHAIAAAHLRPFSLADKAVTDGLGSTGPKSGESGAKGLYGLYAEAYRQAAAERNILPRQMQSITWEALRGLWSPAEKRSAAIKNGVNQTWSSFGRRGRGGLTLPQVQQNLIGKGIRPPSWFTGGPGEELEP